MSLRPGQNAWARLRAALITIFLLSQCASAIPTRALTTDMLLLRPEGLRFVRLVRAVADAGGWHMDDTAMADALRRASETIITWRTDLLSPCESLFQWLGIRQQWSLFMIGGGAAFRIRIETRLDAGDWQVVYEANRTDRYQLAPCLSYRRLRGIYSPGARSGPNPQYQGFVSWLAAKLFREHPEIDAVRVSMERLTLPRRDRPMQTLSVDYGAVRLRGRQL